MGCQFFQQMNLVVHLKRRFTLRQAFISEEGGLNDTQKEGHTVSNTKGRGRLLKKVGRLKQRDEHWEGTLRLARTWIDSGKEPPYRPYLVLLVSQDGAILRSDISDEPPSPDQRFETLLHAMRRPMLGAGRARRPKVIYLDDPDDVAALSPQLEELGVRCEYRRSLPTAGEALYSMERMMSGGEVVPGLLTIPSVTVPLVEHLYQLAADFYRAMPWRWLDDNHSLEIRYPPEGKPRYAVVMGSGGEVYGLAVYDTLDDLRLMFREDLSPQQTAKMTTWSVLFFEEAMAMTFDDLDAMAKYGWEAATQSAYPVFGRTTLDAGITPPPKADVFWMEGALASILAYLPEHKRKGWNFLQSTETTVSIKTISGEAEVHLKIPAFD